MSAYQAPILGVGSVVVVLLFLYWFYRFRKNLDRRCDEVRAFQRRFRATYFLTGDETEASDFGDSSIGCFVPHFSLGDAGWGGSTQGADEREVFSRRMRITEPIWIDWGEESPWTRRASPTRHCGGCSHRNNYDDGCLDGELCGDGSYRCSKDLLSAKRGVIVTPPPYQDEMAEVGLRREKTKLVFLAEPTKNLSSPSPDLASLSPSSPSSLPSSSPPSSSSSPSIPPRRPHDHVTSPLIRSTPNETDAPSRDNERSDVAPATAVAPNGTGCSPRDLTLTSDRVVSSSHEATSCDLSLRSEEARLTSRDSPPSYGEVGEERRRVGGEGGGIQGRCVRFVEEERRRRREGEERFIGRRQEEVVGGVVPSHVMPCDVARPSDPSSRLRGAGDKLANASVARITFTNAATNYLNAATHYLDAATNNLDAETPRQHPSGVDYTFCSPNSDSQIGYSDSGSDYYSIRATPISNFNVTRSSNDASQSRVDFELRDPPPKYEDIFC